MNRSEPDNDELTPAPGQFQYRLLHDSAKPEEIIPPLADAHIGALIRLHFTRYARVVMVRARAIAVRWGAVEMAVEHLLLGILEWESLPSIMSDGPESAVLAQAVEASITRGATPRPDVLPVTDEVRRVIESAQREAQNRGFQRVGVGPLLLGITLESGSSAQECMTRYGVTYEQLRSGLASTAFTD